MGVLCALWVQVLLGWLGSVVALLFSVVLHGSLLEPWVSLGFGWHLGAVMAPKVLKGSGVQLWSWQFLGASQAP